MNKVNKLIFETTSNPKEEISAFAFNVGKMVEKLIDERTDNLEYSNKYTEAKILDFYAKLEEGSLKEKYKKHFNILSSEQGSNV